MAEPSPPISKSSLRTIDLRPRMGEMIKPAELIDISGTSGLTLAARRLYNKLIAHAFGADMASEGHEWTISLSELRGTHKGNERIEDSILSLMRTVVTVKLADGRTRRVQLLGGNDLGDADRPRGTLTYSFDPRLVALLKNSTVFGKLEVQVMMAFSTKYALALYEAIARRVRELRDVLGVPDGKLVTFGNLNQFALKPAIAEINAMASFGVNVMPIKQGRKVTSMRVGWWSKSENQLRDAFTELNRHKAGRKARIRGTVEEVI